MMTNGDQIAASLRLLRTCWPDMLPEGVSAGMSPHTTGSKEPPPPAPIAVLSLRREVCQLLAAWVHVVIDDAVDINGDTMVVHLDGNDAMALAGWLMTWAEFLGAHDAAEDAVTEIGQVARACHAIVTQRRVRRFPVGPCVEHATTDKGERVPCPGHLVAVLRSDDDLLPHTLRCSADAEHSYDAATWRRLGERIHGQEKAS